MALAVAELTDQALDAEASLRIGPDGSVRGGRMMLERAGADVARRIADGLALPWAPQAVAIVDACDVLRLPLIAGWDVGGATPKYKLYANASDASGAKGAELLRRCSVAPRPGAAIVGINVGHSGVETKLYVQRPSLADLGLALEVPAAFAAIEAAAWVASYDMGEGRGTLRSVFAATMHDREASAEAALRTLRGVDWASLEGSFPFAPGPLRQLGWAQSGEVTVYAKRRGRAVPVHALAPLAVFRRGDCEVGLYVTPGADTPRAFLRTAASALSFRTRSGAPEAAALEALGAWAQERVAGVEELAGAEAADLRVPPGGWVRVED